MKQDIVNDKLDSSKTFHTDPYHASLHRAQAQHLSDLSALYPDVTRTPGRLASYPGAEMHPYHIALWGPVWDIHKRLDQSFTQNALKSWEEVGNQDEMEEDIVELTTEWTFPSELLAEVAPCAFVIIMVFCGAFAIGVKLATGFV